MDRFLRWLWRIACLCAQALSILRGLKWLREMFDNDLTF